MSRDIFSVINWRWRKRNLICWGNDRKFCCFKNLSKIPSKSWFRREKNNNKNKKKRERTNCEKIFYGMILHNFRVWLSLEFPDHQLPLRIYWLRLKEQIQSFNFVLNRTGIISRISAKKCAQILIKLNFWLTLQIESFLPQCQELSTRPNQKYLMLTLAQTLKAKSTAIKKISWHRQSFKIIITVINNLSDRHLHNYIEQKANQLNPIDILDREAANFKSILRNDLKYDFFRYMNIAKTVTFYIYTQNIHIG